MWAVPRYAHANFPQCICAKNYENWLAVDKVIAKIIRLTFLAHPVLNNGQDYPLQIAKKKQKYVEIFGVSIGVSIFTIIQT